MKRYLIMASLLSWLFGCNSSSTCFTYTARENQQEVFEFRFDPSDSVAQKLKISTFLHNVADTSPWTVQLAYSGERRFAVRIKGIDLILSGKKTNETEYNVMVPVSPQIISNDIKNYYYYNPPFQSGKTTFEDFIYPNDRNKDNTINYFWLDQKFQGMPDELRAEIKIRWDNGETSFSTLLVRKEQYCSKPSNRPFG